MGKWSREATLLLIQEVKKLPLLYDPKDRSYHSRRDRRDAMYEIATHFSEVRPGTTGEDVKIRWNALRSAFNACLVKLKRQVKGSGKPEATKVWYFDDMLFISDVMQTRNGYHFTSASANAGMMEGVAVVDIPTHEENTILPFAEETMEEISNEDLSGENHLGGSLSRGYLHEGSVSRENPAVEQCPGEDLLREYPERDDRSNIDAHPTEGNDAQDTGSSRRRTRRNHDDVFFQTVECAMRKLAERPTEDADFVFGKFVAHELKSLNSPILKRRLKNKILMDIVEIQNSHM